MLAALLFAAIGFTPATAHRIDAIAAAEIASHRAPGIAVGVVESGRLVYARGFGFANVRERIRVSPGTQFALGGISEQFIAAAVLLLAQDGKLGLDDPVTKYLPKVAARGVTIRELLDGTSGLPNVAGHASSPPGTAYSENPLDYVLAGRIVERVAGEPLSDYVEQHIFVPLVIDASLWFGDTGLGADHAVGYTKVNGRFVPVRPSATRPRAGAGVISDVYDLAKWDIEFPVLLRVDAVRDMFTPALPSAFVRHGMGWTLDRRSGHRFVWQNGEIPGFHTMNALLPDEHVAVIVLVNADARNEPTTLPESIAGRVLDVVVPPVRHHLDNAIVTRARQLLAMLQSGRLDRTQLTPAFSSYLSDDLVVRADLGALGRVRALVPIASTSSGAGTTYEFLVLFAKGERHFQMTVQPDGKIASLSFNP
ncbi:MAG: serine hydrolase domain-containing protein [Candidatus Tyrphobacter sp.]